jgi:CheY-like chemotaxis protein
MALQQMALQVLLAEDEALVALALAEFLAMEGHRVTVAHDGLEALEAARDLSRLDLLITDLQMPCLGGESLIRALWAERPGLPVTWSPARHRPAGQTRCGVPLATEGCCS